ncbi:MAG: carbohydrate ABC transporter permease [Pseudomonadota bacterium]
MIMSRTLPIYAVLTAVSVLLLAPLILTLFTAFKPPAQIAEAPWLLPDPPVLTNFATAWSEGRFSQYFLNSVIISTVDVLIMVPLASMTAYGLVFLNIPGRRSLLLLFLAGLIVPPVAIILPLYTTVRDFGLVNTHLGVILADVALALPLFLFLMYAFFVKLPKELHDAAKIDGAGELRTFWSVMLPLAKPAVITVALLEFLFSWNDLLLRLVFLTTDSLRTLTVGLLFFQGTMTRNVAGITAAAVIMAIPIVVLFLTFQRHFMQGMTAGAVK